MLRKTLLSLASAFLIWQSYQLVSVIHQLEINSWGLLLIIAWLINLFITGIVAFLGFAFPIHKLMPISYYKIYQPTHLKKVYKALRVSLFRQLLLATLWKSKKQRKKYYNGSKNGIANLKEQSMRSEFGHLIPFLVICLLSCYFITIDLVSMGIYSFVINFIGNFYPILLQRHHRMRIQLMSKVPKSIEEKKIEIQTLG